MLNLCLDMNKVATDVKQYLLAQRFGGHLGNQPVRYSAAVVVNRYCNKVLVKQRDIKEKA